MRIGILTLPLHTNYGGILQAYALQTVLERMGHEVKVFDKRAIDISVPPLWKIPLLYTYRYLKKISVDSKIIINREYRKKKEFPIIKKNTQKFIDRYIHTFGIDCFDELHNDDFDAIIVGSDQIWRPKYFIRLWGGDFSNAFLNFTSSWNVIRIAYAVSFGTNEWEIPMDQIDILSKLSNNFHSISVREKDGLELCSSYLSIHAEQVLDPTLLLNTTDYVSISREHWENNTDTQLFCYVLDRNDEINKLTEIVSKHKGIPPFFFNNNNIQDDIESRIYKTVERWIQSFVEAEFIITDSYHDCVLSIFL